ncbi:MAG: hypothetical protein WBL72_06155 [Thermoguttaceae bacterium]
MPSNNWSGGTSTELGNTANWSGSTLPTYNNSGTMGSCTNYPASGACNGAMSLTGGTSAKINGGCWSGAITVGSGTQIAGGYFLGSVAVNSSGTITGGTFYGTVTVNAGGSISGGTFYGAVTNSGTITGGNFNIANGTLTAGQGVSNVVYFVAVADRIYVTADLSGGEYPTTTSTQAADAATLTAAVLNIDGSDTTVAFGASNGTAKTGAVYTAGQAAGATVNYNEGLAAGHRANTWIK